ncbi:MAG: hypothetical protein HKM06_05735, partial [Spirochaetales bacterium]|nr:hypothetical protein [Spirochaetales bacterium]
LQSMTFTNLVPQLTGLSNDLIVTTPPNPVAVRVRGNKATLSKLTADNVHVQADLSSFTAPGEAVDVPLKVILPSGVDLIEVSPAVTDLILEKKP